MVQPELRPPKNLNSGRSTEPNGAKKNPVRDRGLVVKFFKSSCQFLLSSPSFHDDDPDQTDAPKKQT